MEKSAKPGAKALVPRLVGPIRAEQSAAPDCRPFAVWDEAEKIRLGGGK